jgi:hypothetical protein
MTYTEASDAATAAEDSLNVTHDNVLGYIEQHPLSSLLVAFLVGLFAGRPHRTVRSRI